MYEFITTVFHYTVIVIQALAIPALFILPLAQYRASNRNMEPHRAHFDAPVAECPPKAKKAQDFRRFNVNGMPMLNKFVDVCGNPYGTF